MKRVLIVGKNSHVGSSVKKYLEKWPKKYQIDSISVRGDDWKERDFSKYNVVFYAAGIAHINSKKEMEKKKELYYQVNTDLAEEVAKKAKDSGVGQFIYMSSMSIYGDSAPVGKERVINKNTKPAPTTIYGDSKLKAEKKLNKLDDKNFKIVLLRPPMIYGANCKGNYQSLRKLALKLPVFPKVYNSRSMIFIDNFSDFVKQIIDDDKKGVFYPTNNEQISTCDIVRQIAKCHNKKIVSVPGLKWAMKLMSHFTSIVNKAFGNMVYDKEISEEYKCCYSTIDSIKKIEKEM